MWFLQFLPSDWSRDLGLICQQVLLVAGTAPDSEVSYLFSRCVISRCFGSLWADR